MVMSNFTVSGKHVKVLARKSDTGAAQYDLQIAGEDIATDASYDELIGICDKIAGELKACADCWRETGTLLYKFNEQSKEADGDGQ